MYINIGGTKMNYQQNLETVGIIETAANEMKGLLELAQSYVDANEENHEVQNLGLIIERMTEHINKIYGLFEEKKIDELLNS